ncbi:hypothetical protein BASA83_011651 [Batrachochytrium salamandrivorans]|nr:hypothetical protein BASA83_011651 [Batrachochytrium salamandrivorans]
MLPRPCIHVLGAGAVGLLHAAHLSRAASPLSTTSPLIMLLLRQSRLTAFPPDGFWLTQTCASSAMASIQRHQRIQVKLPFQDTHHATPISTLILSTRAHQAWPALQSVLHRLTPSPTILLLQNGVLAVHDEIQRNLTLARPDLHPTFLLGLTTHGITRSATDPFDLDHVGFGNTIIGCALPTHTKDMDANNSRHTPTAANALLDILSSGWKSLDVFVKPPTELTSHLMLKLIVNACINPVVALLGRPNGTLLSTPDGPELVMSLCAELAPLALPHLKSLNILSIDSMAAAVMDVVRKTHLNRNSMLVDIDNGNNTEIEYLNGYLIQLANKQGMSLPMHSLLTRMIRLK